MMLITANILTTIDHFFHWKGGNSSGVVLSCKVLSPAMAADAISEEPLPINMPT
ncbi:hypothetical protein HRJ45_23675 [Vibrio coralliilyticus]|nr:hypothetical protein [Vibrio coralliilyticus]